MDADSSLMFPIESHESQHIPQESPFFPIIPAASNEIEMATRVFPAPASLSHSLQSPSAHFPVPQIPVPQIPAHTSSIPVTRHSPPLTPKREEENTVVLPIQTTGQHASRREDIELDFSGGSRPERTADYNTGLKGWLLN